MEVGAPLQPPGLDPGGHPRHDPGREERGHEGPGTPQRRREEHGLRRRARADGSRHERPGSEPPEDPPEGGSREQLDDVQQPRRDRPSTHPGRQPDLAAAARHGGGRRGGDEGEGHHDAEPADDDRAALGRGGQLGGTPVESLDPAREGRAQGHRSGGEVRTCGERAAQRGDGGRGAVELREPVAWQREATLGRPQQLVVDLAAECSRRREVGDHEVCPQCGALRVRGVLLGGEVGPPPLARRLLRRAAVGLHGVDPQDRRAGRGGVGQPGQVHGDRVPGPGTRGRGDGLRQPHAPGRTRHPGHHDEPVGGVVDTEQADRCARAAVVPGDDRSHGVVEDPRVQLGGHRLRRHPGRGHAGHVVEGGHQVRPLAARGVDAAAEPHDRPLLRCRAGGHRLQHQAQRRVGGRLDVERARGGRQGDHREHGDHEAQAERVVQEPPGGQAPHGRQDVVPHPRRSIGLRGTAAPTRLLRHTMECGAHPRARGAPCPFPVPRCPAVAEGT